MVRDRTARARIREHLLTGPVSASSGYATNALRDAIDYQGSAVAFIQLVAAMEKDGEIERDVRGKRTYRISAGPRAVPTPSSDGSDSDAAATQVADNIDYNLLARAIVREMVAGAEQMSAERDAYIERLREARSRIDNLLGDAFAPERR